MGVFRRPVRVGPAIQLPQHNRTHKDPPRELCQLEHTTKTTHSTHNKEIRAKVLLTRTGMLFFGLAMVSAVGMFSSSLSSSSSSTLGSEFEFHQGPRRSLLSNESHSGAMWETCDFEMGTGNQAGWVVLYILATMHFFVGIAILCDGYFVDSLETISEVLNLSPDVAGATFMAAGSSAPELFTSLAGISVQSDVGVGTIVGSAVFNVLVIIALSAAVAGEELPVDWKIFTRDAIHYATSIIVFIVFSWDGYFEWWEGVILIALYAVYVGNMFVNESVMNAVTRLTGGNKVGATDSETKEESTKAEQRLITTAPSDGKGAGAPIKQSRLRINRFEEGAETPTTHTAEEMIGDRRTMRRTSSLNDEDFKSFVRQVSSSSFRMEKKFNSEDDLSARIPEHVHHFVRNNDGKFSSLLSRSPSTRRVDRISSSNQNLGMRMNSSDPTVKAPVTMSPLATAEAKAPKNNNTTNTNNTNTNTTTNTTTNNNITIPSGTLHNIVLESPLTTQPSGTSMQPPGKAVGDVDDSDADDDDYPSCQQRCRHPCFTNDGTCLEVDESKEGFGRMLRLILGASKLLITAPYDWVFMNTIPPAKYYKLSFSMSIFWIMVLSFGMVTSVIRLGCIIGIDDYVMGLVIVAAGTSVPDALTSMAVAKGGFADMSVSNALGSNVFDINLGLGIPMVLSYLIHGKHMDLLTPEDRIAYDQGELIIIDHVKFGFILLAILILTGVCFKFLNFKLNKKLGIGFAFLYVIFVTYALVQELVCKRTGNPC